MGKRKILVTSALPYANGSIHLGHLMEYIQADIWVRFQKLKGNECVFFCADDTHGSPIMITAKKKGIAPEDLIAEKKIEHLEDFEQFEICFTHYSSTNTEINRELSYKIYHAMREKNHIKTKVIDQMHCEHCQMFLPDRFIKGDCPNCQAKDQYGDSCEKCGFIYTPNELLNPYCVTCNNVPKTKKSEHIFFQLNHFKEFLQEWLESHVSEEMKNKLLEWFSGDLKDWDISRDAPYFGFLVPNYSDKYFYVWIDAPIGYIASTEEWLRSKSSEKNYEHYWKNQAYEIYHFIGKDIIYFHSLFWPAMLNCADLSTPQKIFAHGFLTLEGQKMSKSRKIFINARDYLKSLSPLYLRYYLAAKITPSLSDIDLNLKDFENRINSELVGKITNLPSRAMKLLKNNFNLQVSKMSAAGREMREAMLQQREVLSDNYESRNFLKVVLKIRELAEQSNRYFNEQKPWELVKQDSHQAQMVITDVLNFFRIINIFLTPILPSYSKKVEKLFLEENYTWKHLDYPLEDKALNEYEHLLTRMSKESLSILLN